MARINIDDALLADARFKALGRALGGEDMALGMCFRAFRVGLKYWGDGKLVPERIWKIEGLEPLIEVDLAERREDGVYVRGSEQQFEWYRQRVEAGRKRGAEAPRNPDGTFARQPPADQRTASEAPAGNQRPLEKHPAAIQPPAPALAHALALEELPNGSSLSPGGGRGVDPRFLLALWNRARAPCQPEATSFTSGSRRWRVAATRLREQPDPNYWRQVIERIAASSFCRGEVESRDGRKPWVADFDFLVRPDSHVKVMEGKYDDREANAGRRGSDIWFAQMQREGKA